MHSRELIVGFEWSSNPVMWTYTTIHTLVGGRASAVPGSQRNRADTRRVLVVESDAGIRRALSWCLDQQAGIFCVTCGSAELFARDFALHKPHMVMLNRNLAGRLGFASPGQVALLHQNVPGLTYSTCVDGDHLFVSTPGGSEGYLLKRVKPTRLLEPVLNEAGQPKFSTSDLQERVKAYFKTLLPTRSDHDPSALARLTRREREVLDLLSKGCVDKEIAQALGISAWTVHDHIKNIFDRLRVRTRTEAVVRYLEK
jgi:DNA-binding NarL/FixJ family response regulator